LYYIKFSETDENYNTEYEATNDDMKFLSELQGSPFYIEDFEAIISLWEKKVLANDVLPFEEMLISLPSKYQDKSSSVHQLYNYWVSLRVTLKGPLMRKYKSKPDPSNADPNVTFRPFTENKPSLRKTKKNESDNITKVCYNI
jgi:hypothetical protein